LAPIGVTGASPPGIFSDGHNRIASQGGDLQPVDFLIDGDGFHRRVTAGAALSQLSELNSAV